MKILVCITHVPDTTSKIQFTDNDTVFDKKDVSFIIGPYDDYALARAVELKNSNDAEVTVLNVGTLETEPTIRKALAIGADRSIRINANPKSGFFVAQQIAHFAKDKNFDMILMGKESIDFNGNQVHSMVGALLDIPALSPIMSLVIDGKKATLSKEIDNGKENIEIELPFVAGCQEPIAEWKIPNMRGIMSARSKSLDVLEPLEISETITISKFDLPKKKSSVKMVDAENLEELINLLKNEAKVI